MSDLLFRKRDIPIINKIISKSIYKFVMIGDRAFKTSVEIDFEMRLDWKTVILVSSRHDSDRLHGLRKGAAIYYVFGRIDDETNCLLRMADIEEVVDLRYAKNFLRLMQSVRLNESISWSTE